jgi:hypothetical protein
MTCKQLMLCVHRKTLAGAPALPHSQPVIDTWLANSCCFVYTERDSLEFLLCLFCQLLQLCLSFILGSPPEALANLLWSCGVKHNGVRSHTSTSAL